MNDELQDRTRSLRSDPFQSPENGFPSIPNHRSCQLRSARGYSRAAPCAEVRERCGMGMPVSGFGMRRAPASRSRCPLPACPLQPEPPGHPALRPVPVLTVRGFLKEKNQRTWRLSAFLFRTYLGPSWQCPTKVGRSGECRVPALERGLFPGCPRSPRAASAGTVPASLPHASPRQGSRPRGRTYRLGRCASRSRSQCHAEPRRRAPPATGVTAGRGVPLPGGDMA